MKQNTEPVTEISSYEQQAQEFLKATGSIIKTSYKEHSAYFDEADYTRDIYSVTIRNFRGSYTFKFGQSKALSNGNTPPTAYDILACLTKSDPGSFEWFCSNYGYDTDSRKAEKTYKAICKEYSNLCRLFTEEELEAMQEIQ